ncbi:MAG: 30S ribosome-binding factor RbfA [Gammaproteobacteria bacterium]|mgnify:FL=1|jgi:ribosome-binding factor A|nr:30S ribosome-binding factor RbfA [Gammaproteobacteria bacterium]MBT5406649.1 30S ribosome-binding factor RbfA [Gammaproteobacteria bacterium]MBT5644685.1 30S ribosome-binding factor RbfA [Gammaproteobacteria bacterium]MBT5863111.1 30S ribosome-binding factor RbfA [Gammaproteobacteria bacterium]MBT6734489.1 30S ribosome-binding factor RbfA [Gammaproteobacteria bacterium]|tara:strand:- start:1698 stop:2033 length:336 start_codon:yes stop_codon:yes gene_type:complete
MTNRLFKVQDLLHKEIALLLIKDIQNPLIKSVTISEVKVSKDLRYSEIYFTSLNKDNKKIENELNKASGFIRNALSKSVHLKRLPSIRFTYDDTAERSERIESILKSDLKI